MACFSHDRARKKLYDLLGDKCVRCGFSDFRALQVDHVNDDGNKYRAIRISRKFGSGDMVFTYLRIAEREKNDVVKTIQLLCANCNWIKEYDRREKRGKFISFRGSECLQNSNAA